MTVPTGPATGEARRTIHGRGVRIVSRADSADAILAAVESAGTLFDHAAGHPDAVRLDGRGPAYHVPGVAGRWVVRHYRRGGAVARWLADRYLRLGTPRPIRELRASEAVRARGVATPEVIAAVIYPAGPFYRADLAVRYVPGSMDLARVLFGPDEPGLEDRLRACEAVAELLRSLPLRGIEHPDLNLKNVLIEWSGRRPRAHLLDLDRCRVGPVRRRQARRMWRRFQRSLAKWESRTGRTVPPAERLALDPRYE